MDMFKSEKEKELLIISLIWVLGQLTGSPSCFASHSVVYAVTLFTKSPLTQDLFQSSCVWNLLAFVGVGGGEEGWGAEGRWHCPHWKSRDIFIMDISPGICVTQENGPGKVLNGLAIPMSGDLCLDKNLPSLFHPSAQAHWLLWLPKQLNPGLPLGEPTTAEFLCEANHIIPLGNKRCILRGTYAGPGPGLLLWHTIRSQTWFLLGQGGPTRSRWKSQIIRIPHVTIPVILSLLTFAGETRLFLDSKSGLQTHSHFTEKGGKCATFSVGASQTHPGTPREIQRDLLEHNSGQRFKLVF